MKVVFFVTGAIIVFFAILNLAGVTGEISLEREKKGIAAGGGTPGSSDKAVNKDALAVARSNNILAFDLYGKLRGRKDNIVLSPWSLTTCLAMCYAGGRGETAREMEKALHFTLPRDPLHKAFGRLIEVLGRNEAGYKLCMANALWLQKGYSLDEAYMSNINTFWGASAQEVDFGNPEDASGKINGWVKESTAGKIEKLISPDKIDSLTRLIITGAVYFNGAWLSPFRRENSVTGDFHCGDGSTVHVPMMNQTGFFSYFEGKGFQILEMPYKGRALSMILLLPAKNRGMPEFERNVSLGKIEGWLGKLQRREVDLCLPRFEITSDFLLARALSELGMRLPFGDKADFSGMTGKKAPGKGLFLGEIIHRSFLEVNEEGTEAAAATASMVAADGEERVDFRADHPFLFLVRDRQNGVILFMGRLSKPLNRNYTQEHN